jgi:hypothetical protein
LRVSLMYPLDFIQLSVESFGQNSVVVFRWGRIVSDT